MTRTAGIRNALLRRLATLLRRRGLRHMTKATVAALLACAAILLGHVLICVALRLPARGWPLATVLGLSGTVIRLAGQVGLTVVLAVLVPLLALADCLAPQRSASHHTRAARSGPADTGGGTTDA